MFGKRLVIGAAAFGVVAGLTGCGSSGGANSNASVTIGQVLSAARSASSVHIHGTVTKNSQTISLDLNFIKAGQVSGTVTVPTYGTIGIIDVGTSAYVKLSMAFLQVLHAPTSLCARVCGKYVQLPSAQVSSLTSSFTLSKLFSQMPHGKIVNAGTTTVNGQQAIVLKAPDGSTIDVAASGTPYPLAVNPPPSSGASGQLLFDQWNSVGPISAPPASEVVSLSSLSGG